MKTLIVGLGSPHGDDQLGWAIVDELQKTLDKDTQVTLFKSKGNGTDWMHELGDHQQLIFVDALLSEQPVGTITKIDLDDESEFPANLSSSSHSISLAEGIALSRSLGMLTIPVKIIGVEAGCDAPLSGISSGVIASFPGLMQQLMQFIRET